jgi:hypothetical protein
MNSVTKYKLRKCSNLLREIPPGPSGPKYGGYHGFQSDSIFRELLSNDGFKEIDPL